MVIMLDDNNLTPREKLTKGRTKLNEDHPFHAYMALHLKFIEEPKIPTMCVDVFGKCLYNPDFIKSLSVKQTMGLLAHETWHLCLLHLARLGNRNPQLFNYANDLLANYLCKESGLSLPTEGLIPDNDNSFEIFGKKIEDIDKKCSEQIYDEFEKMPKMKVSFNMTGEGDGSGESGGLTEQEEEEAGTKLERNDQHVYGVGKEQKKENGISETTDVTTIEQDLKEKWKQIISEGAAIAKQQGKLPRCAERIVGEILDSKMNWKQILYKYLVSMVPYDFTYSKPHKKTWGVGYYSPQILREDIEMAFHIDTSGSMDQEDLAQALGELQSILNSFINVKIYVLVGDAQMHQKFELTQDNADEIINNSLEGGGGTDHLYVFKHMKEELPELKVLICYTDGYTNFPNEEDEILHNTVWVISKGGVQSDNIPFGEVIRIES